MRVYECTCSDISRLSLLFHFYRVAFWLKVRLEGNCLRQKLPVFFLLY